MPETYTVFDAANHLKTHEEIILYLEASTESGDPAEMIAAIRTIARAKGMAGVARRAAITREGLYKALDDGTKPGFATIVQVVEALGLKLSFRPQESGMKAAAARGAVKTVKRATAADKSRPRPAPHPAR